MLHNFYALLRIQWVDFRTFVIGWVSEFLVLPIRLFIVITIFSRVLRTSSAALDYTIQEIGIYYFVILFVGRFIGAAMTVAYQVWDDIQSGTLALYLARPLYYPLYLFLKVLSLAVIKLACAAVLFVPLAAFAGWGPYNFSTFLLFLAALTLAFCITFLIQLNIGLLSFWLEKTLTLRDLVWNLNAILSGWLIPLALFPSWLVTLGRWLPFQFVFYIPASIYLGKLPTSALWLIFPLGALWVALGSASAALLYHHGVIRYDAPGGG